MLKTLKKDNEYITHKQGQGRHEKVTYVYYKNKKVLELWNDIYGYVIYTNTLSEEEKESALEFEKGKRQHNPDLYKFNQYYHHSDANENVGFHWSMLLSEYKDAFNVVSNIISIYEREIDGKSMDAKIVSQKEENAMFNMTKYKEVLEHYKDGFDSEHWNKEGYKWEMVKHFQDNWDVDAEDFAGMLKESLAKTDNILTSSRRFPAGMIIGFAERAPEEVRSMFINLYDESKDVFDRINDFANKSEYMLENYWKGPENHYQDLNSISTYLWLRYPDKYYIYKYTVIKETADELEADYQFKRGEHENNFRNFLELYNGISAELQKEKELTDIVSRFITSSCYPDTYAKTLTVDFGYYISRYYKSLKEESKDKELDDFWPSYEDYPVDISKEDWKRFIEEVEYPNHKGAMRVLKCYVDIGGTASPTKMSETYKGHSMVYTGSISNTSRRALKYFDMEPCIDKKNDTQWLFPIAFQGKRGEGNDKGTYVYKMRPELMEALSEMNLDDIELEYSKGMEEMSAEMFSKNTILYGPPGTGKTYSSILYAVGICDGKSVDELNGKKYGEVLERFNELRDEGRIAFTTFHQSYGYEEFIEGIKPVVDESEDNDRDISYVVADGLFKKFCNSAEVPAGSTSGNDYGLNNHPNVWKVSLEGTGENPTRTECMENGHVRIGWDEYGERITDETDYSNGGKIVLDTFINKMQIGDIVLSCYSASTIDAIGVVTGEYEWNPGYTIYRRVRNVNWLVKDLNYNIVELNGGASMTLATVYKMRLTVSDVLGILKEVGVQGADPADTQKKPYVFIIDEINRGNISKIFGELITLIEPSKRIGAKEEMKLLLPYSGKKFGVPDNVYILGTMNTADRSIALMDTALRRRFDFVEMMPDYDVIKGITVESDGVYVDIAKMLEIMNKRIEYLYDREHTLGHSYFIGLKEDASIEKLAEIFDKRIIPLLKEYFYEDYGKIQMVLGDDGKSDEYKFILDTKISLNDIFNGDTSELDISDNSYEIQKDALLKIQSYKEIAKDL